VCEVIPFPKAPPVVLLAVRPSPVYVPPSPVCLFDARQPPVRILPWILAALTATAASYGVPVFLEHLL
jgi:hypothetical protein